jgi:hypothetical protein
MQPLAVRILCVSIEILLIIEMLYSSLHSKVPPKSVFNQYNSDEAIHCKIDTVHFLIGYTSTLGLAYGSLGKEIKPSRLSACG